MANTCIAPAEIQPWQFEAALYGEADVNFAGHLERCNYCRGHLDDLRQEQQLLRRFIARADCPTPDELLAHKWKGLPSNRSDEIDAHLKDCPFCAQEQTQFLGPLVATMPDPAASLRDRLSRQLSVFVARLLPQNRELATARRGPSHPNAPITLTYAIDAKDWEITLAVLANASAYLLSGQLLGPLPEELSDVKVSVISSAGQVVWANIDATGWFELSLAAGEYAVWLELGDESNEHPIRLVIDHVKLGG